MTQFETKNESGSLSLWKYARPVNVGCGILHKIMPNNNENYLRILNGFLVNDGETEMYLDVNL